MSLPLGLKHPTTAFPIAEPASFRPDILHRHLRVCAMGHSISKPEWHAQQAHHQVVVEPSSRPRTKGVRWFRSRQDGHEDVSAEYPALSPCKASYRSPASRPGSLPDIQPPSATNTSTKTIWFTVQSPSQTTAKSAQTPRRPGNHPPPHHTVPHTRLPHPPKQPPPPLPFPLPNPAAHPHRQKPTHHRRARIPPAENARAHGCGESVGREGEGGETCIQGGFEGGTGSSV